MASTILSRVPPPSRSGTTTAAAAARCGRRSGTKPVSSIRGPASASSDGGGRPPMILQRASGCSAAMCGQMLCNEVGHAVDIGDGGQQPEIDHGAAVGRRVRGARLVVLDVCGVGHDRRAGTGHLVEQATLICRAAQIDPVCVAIGTQLLTPQLAPVGPGIQATAQTAVGPGELPRQVVGDLVRVYDQRWWLLPRRGLAQVVVAKVRELQVDDVEPLGAQDPVQGLLQRRQRDPQPLEASDRGQRAELQQPFAEAFPAAGVRDQHHLAAVGLHGPAALVDVELVVDHHDRRQIVASRQLGHKPVDPRLGAEPRRAGRHLRDAKDVEALRAHWLRFTVTVAARAAMALLIMRGGCVGRSTPA